MVERRRPESSQILKICGVADRFTNGDDVHVVANLRSTGDDVFSFAFAAQRHLAVQTFAVPAEISVRDTFEVEVLNAPQNAVIGRHLAYGAADRHLNEPIERFKNVGHFVACHILPPAAACKRSFPWII